MESAAPVVAPTAEPAEDRMDVDVDLTKTVVEASAPAELLQKFNDGSCPDSKLPYRNVRNWWIKDVSSGKLVSPPEIFFNKRTNLSLFAVEGELVYPNRKDDPGIPFSFQPVRHLNVANLFSIASPTAIYRLSKVPADIYMPKIDEFMTITTIVVALKQLQGQNITYEEAMQKITAKGVKEESAARVAGVLEMMNLPELTAHPAILEGLTALAAKLPVAPDVFATKIKLKQPKETKKRKLPTFAADDASSGISSAPKRAKKASSAKKTAEVIDVDAQDDSVQLDKNAPKMRQVTLAFGRKRALPSPIATPAAEPAPPPPPMPASKLDQIQDIIGINIADKNFPRWLAIWQFFQSFAEELSCTPDDDKKQPANKAKKWTREQKAEWAEYTLYNIIDALSDNPVRGLAGIKLCDRMFMYLVRFFQRDAGRRRDSKAFRTSAKVRGYHNKLMNMAAYMPCEAATWTSALGQLLWELEYERSPEADEEPEDNEGENSQDENSDDEDNEADDEKKIAANRDPEIARASRRMRRIGWSAFNTVDERTNLACLLIDYACQTSIFKRIVADIDREVNDLRTRIGAVAQEFSKKKADIEKQIVQEKTTVREQRARAKLATAAPPLEGLVAPSSGPQPQTEASPKKSAETSSSLSEAASASAPVSVSVSQPASTSAPALAAIKPMSLKQIKVADDETETLVRLCKERDDLKRQAEERRQDLTNQQQEKMKRISTRPLGMDRFMNVFWMFKGDEIGDILFVEHPRPFKVDKPEDGESRSVLLNDPEWTSSSRWFVVSSKEELKAIEDSLNKQNRFEAGLLDALAEVKPRLLQNDFFTGARFEQDIKTPNYLDKLFKQKRGVQMDVDEPHWSDEEIKKYHEKLAMERFKELKQMLQTFYQRFDPECVRIDRNWDAVKEPVENIKTPMDIVPALRAFLDTVKSDALQKSWSGKRPFMKHLLKFAEKSQRFDVACSAAYFFLQNIRALRNPLADELNLSKKDTPSEKQSATVSSVSSVSSVSRPSRTRAAKPATPTSLLMAGTSTRPRHPLLATVIESSTESNSSGDDSDAGSHGGGSEDESEGSSESRDEESSESGEEFRGPRGVAKRTVAKRTIAKRAGAKKASRASARVSRRSTRINSESEESADTPSESESEQSDSSSGEESPEEIQPKKRAPPARKPPAAAAPKKRAPPRTLRRIVESDEEEEDEKKPSALSVSEESSSEERPIAKKSRAAPKKTSQADIVSFFGIVPQRASAKKSATANRNIVQKQSRATRSRRVVESSDEEEDDDSIPDESEENSEEPESSGSDDESEPEVKPRGTSTRPIRRARK